MVLTIESSRLEVYHPGNRNPNNQPDFVIPGDHIDTLSLSERIQNAADSASVSLYNDHARYTGQLQHRDMFIFGVTLRKRGPNVPSAYGLTDYGLGQYGGVSPLSREWCGLIRGNIKNSYLGKFQNKIDFEAVDFVFGVLDDRVITESYTEREVADVVRDMVNMKAPEVDLNGVENTGVVTDVFFDGMNLRDAIIELSNHADAVVYATGNTLYFKPLETLSSVFDLDAHDIGEVSISSNDDGMANTVRVDGGTASEIYSQQTTQDEYTTITDTDRVAHQFQMPKATVSNIELWTNTTGSQADMTVRIQADDNGSPTGMENTKLDIAKRTLSYQFLDDDGYTTFSMPDHKAPGQTLWLIAQTNGGEQQVGIDTASGDPAYNAKYEYPVAVRASDNQSVDKYGTIEQVRARENLKTFDAAYSFGQSLLEHSHAPEKTVSGPVQSARLHQIHPGALVNAQFPMGDVSGDYIITERSDQYGENAAIILNTTVQAQKTSTL